MREQQKKNAGKVSSAGPASKKNLAQRGSLLEKS